MLEREEQQRGSENKNSLEIGREIEKDGEEAQQGPVRWASIALCWGGRCLLNIAINRLKPNQCFDLDSFTENAQVYGKENFPYDVRFHLIGFPKASYQIAIE